ncbi:peptide-methionine (S)-S-oxide reductase MsrA [bacterium]|nr:peptide-methionine (S)-S-oxide reductase MsrA [bacterium]
MLLSVLFVIFLFGAPLCSAEDQPSAAKSPETEQEAIEKTTGARLLPVEKNPNAALPTEKVAVFAGGCFWCMEPPFDKKKGVLETISGYTGGKIANPTYSEVTGKNTGHYEALQVRYDPQVVSYEELLEIFWRNIDPFDGEGQFCDRGPQYRAALFVADAEERALAEASLAEKKEELRSRGSVATVILPLSKFYPAEEYHQNYYQKNKLRYAYYRKACGRDKRLEEVWEDAF